MRPNINDIIVDELKAEYDEIMSYRMAVACGIEDHVDPVLEDYDLTAAIQKVFLYYETKIKTKHTHTESPNDIYVDTEIGDIQLNLDYDSDNAYYNALNSEYDGKFTPGGKDD